MRKDLSDVSMSVLNLYEEFIYYLIDNNKLSVSRAPKNKHTKLGDSIRSRNKARDRFRDHINYFEFIIRKRFPDEMLHNFDDNLSDFKIYGICFQLGDVIKKIIKYAGKYQTKKNIIIIDINDEESQLSIFHELFHMASTNRMITDRIQTGFSVIKNGVDTGKGLNEGYTDLLAHRYFGHTGYRIGYPLEYQYAYALERIVGQKKMENWYMSANPALLVRELEKYDSTDNILYFIKLLDNINDEENNVVVRSTMAKDITRMLIQWYTRKIFLSGENLLHPYVVNNIYTYAWQIPAKIANLDNYGSFNIDINGITNDVINEIIRENPHMYRRA